MPQESAFSNNIYSNKQVSSPFSLLGEAILDQEAESVNPFFKVLDILSRPGQAVAGFTEGLTKGDLGKAFSFAAKGFTGDRRTSFDNVLKSLGVPRLGTGVKLPYIGEVTTRGALGFTLDVLSDPLTYVGISTLTKAGRSAKILTANQKKALGSIREAYEDTISQARSAIVKKTKNDLDINFRELEETALKQFEETGTVSDEMQQFFSVGSTVDGPALVRNEFNYQSVLTTRTDDAVRTFEKYDAPVLKKGFLAQKDHIVGTQLKSLHDVLDATTILDLATEVNGKYDLVRRVEDIAPGFLASTRSAQALKGQRSFLTFYGKSLLQASGYPPLTAEKLRQLDATFLKGLDNAFGKLKEWPVFKQIREQLSNKTGIREVDELFSHFSDRRYALEREALIHGVQGIKKQLLLESKTAPEKLTQTLGQVVESMELWNPNNILNESVLEGFSDEVKDLALTLRKNLDDAFRQGSKSAKELGLDLTYLEGYFPRILTKEAKAVFDEAFESGPGRGPSLIRKPETPRVKPFANLTTVEINELFRKDPLQLRFLTERMKQDKGLFSKFLKADPENAALFVEDPAVAVAVRLAQNARTVSRREMIADTLKVFGRRITASSRELQANEVMVLPTELFQTFSKKELSQGGFRKGVRDALELPSNYPNELIDAIKEAYDRVKANELMDAVAKDKKVGVYKAFTELSIHHPHLISALADLKVPFYVMDKAVVRKLDEAWTAINDTVLHNDLVKSHDWIVSLWKRYTLTIFPEFHSRAFISDALWQNGIAGVTKPSEILLKGGAYPIAIQTFARMRNYIIKGVKSLDTLDAINPGHGLSTVDIHGTKLTGPNLYREFVEHGGWGGLLRDTEALKGHSLPLFKEGSLAAKITDTSATLKDKLKTDLKTRAKVSLTNPLKDTFLPIQIGANLGDFLSASLKFAHFISKRKLGLPPEQAMMSVKKYLFDYNDLTVFEKNWMRRIFPFYTWLRKNIPLQIEAMVKRPGNFANLQKAVAAVQDEELREKIGEKNIPNFIKQEFGIVTKEIEGGGVEFLLLGSFIPAADLAKISSYKDFLRLAGKSLNPLAQQAAESATGYNFFSGMKIESYPGEVGTFLGQPVTKRNINLLRKIRLLNTIDKVVYKEDPNNPFTLKRFTPTERFAQVFLGIKPLQINPAKVKKARIFQSRIVGGKIKKALERAEKEGNQGMIDLLKDMLEESKGISTP